MTNKQKVNTNFVCVFALLLLALFSSCATDDGQADFEMGKSIAGTEPGFDSYFAIYGGGRTDYKKAEEYYLSAAKKGHTEAQYTLAKFYSNGCGYSVEDVMNMRIVKVEVIEKDPGKAVKWWTKAAQQGHVKSMVELGNCYLDGNGVKKNPAEAIKWWTTAADHRHVASMARLGDLYRDGKDVDRNMTEAIKWWTKAADYGDEESMVKIGRCYEKGDGVEKDLDEAVKWWQMAIDEGGRDFQKNYASLCEYVSSYQKAKKGDPEEIYKLGRKYMDKSKKEDENDPNAIEAVALYRKAAELGSANAMYQLSSCYMDGIGGVKQDFDEAIKWTQNALDHGYGDSETEEQRERALIAPRARISLANSIKKLIADAESGDPKAMLRLGDRIISGTYHMKKDEAEGVKWYRKAAEQGSTEAMIELGNCYRDGIGVEKDEYESIKWYYKAAKQADKDASLRMDALIPLENMVSQSSDEGIVEQVTKMLEEFGITWTMVEEEE